MDHSVIPAWERAAPALLGAAEREGCMGAVGIRTSDVFSIVLVQVIIRTHHCVTSAGLGTACGVVHPRARAVSAKSLRCKGNERLAVWTLVRVARPSALATCVGINFGALLIPAIDHGRIQPQDPVRRAHKGSTSPDRCAAFLIRPVSASGSATTTENIPSLGSEYGAWRADIRAAMLPVATARV